jgi:hypothetical protein
MGRPRKGDELGEKRILYSFEATDEVMFFYKGFSERWGIPLAALIRMAIHLAEPAMMACERTLHNYAGMIANSIDPQLETIPAADKKVIEDCIATIKAKVAKQNLNTIAEVRRMAAQSLSPATATAPPVPEKSTGTSIDDIIPNLPKDSIDLDVNDILSSLS